MRRWPRFEGSNMKNGMPISALSEFVNEVRETPEEGVACYGVRATWETATRLAVSSQTMRMGGRAVARNFTWKIDEPRQLLGTNHGPTPQEMLLSSVAACISIAFMMGATARGVQVESLEIEFTGALDLRGFMGVEGARATGFPKLGYVLRVAADAPAEVLDEIHKAAVDHSPNAQTIIHATPIQGQLEAKNTE
jgi:uncharacterized OsmC-like protein